MTSIVRIYSNSGKVVGAGFLVSEKYVLTCAHIIADALDVSRATQELPDAKVYLDFPLIAPRQNFIGQVVFWRPVNPNELEEDIAGLELLSPPPREAKPAPLVAAEDLWGHPFRAFGYPTGQRNGVWLAGVLQGKLANGWVQIQAKEIGYKPEPGFCGTPVWDEQLEGVVGIFVASEIGRPEAKVGFIIPTTVLVQAWLELSEQAIILDRSKCKFQQWLTALFVLMRWWVLSRHQVNKQIEQGVSQWESCTDVEAIRKAHTSLAIGKLEDSASVLLRSFSRISEDVDAALNQESRYNQRLALSTIADRLDGLLRELTHSSDYYAKRFRPIASSWRQILSDHVRELAVLVEQNQEIESPYIIGVPLTQQQKIFTGRTDIGIRIEQLLLDQRRPPLLFYGQRRMGKTSLLYNLGRLLPNTIVPMFVDLQGAASRASNHAGFLYNLARGMVDSAERQGGLTLLNLKREELEADPFTRFDEWLDGVEKRLELEQEQKTVLLALDEFEVLDKALTEGRFSETAVLGMLRNLIQHRPRFKVLLSGSHTIEEFQRWASYLINVQVVHISYLKEAEVRQLIEHPVKDFTLRYEPDAVEQVLKLTRCHPFLVQLLCAEIVALKNEQDPSIRRLASLADVEAAVPEALNSGSFFFADIQNNQVNAEGLEVLRFLAAQGEGAIVSKKNLSCEFPDGLNSILNLLLRRELIEQVGDGYRFQVELIRRWFTKAQ
jgi:hypothetical protein